MHISIDLRRMVDAFYTFRNAPGGPIAYFGRINELTHVAKSAVYITDTCVSDALVVYVVVSFNLSASCCMKHEQISVPYCGS